MKTWQIAIFGFVMLLLLWFPYNMIRKSRYILQNGTAYRFLLEPIDPYDIFRGSYVTLNYNLPPVPSTDSMYTFQEVYVTIAKDSAGFAYFENAFAVPPNVGDYLHTTVAYYTDGKIQVDIPENIHYYYLNEKTAPQVERAIAQSQLPGAPENRAYVQIRVRKGEAVVEELYINDLTVKEYFK